MPTNKHQVQQPMIISPQRLAVLAHLAGQSAPVQRAAICSALGIRSGNIEAVLRPLIADRLIREVPRKHDTRNYAPLVAIAPAGRRLLTPDAPPAETPVQAAPKARVSDAGLSVLRFLRAEENAGRKATYRDVQIATGHASHVFGPLRQRKLVTVRGNTLTDFGRKVADGLFAVVPQNHGPAVPMPRRAPSEPPSSGVKPIVPAAFVKFRGFDHPPMPEPGTKPAGMSAERWAHLTGGPATSHHRRAS